MSKRGSISVDASPGEDGIDFRVVYRGPGGKRTLHRFSVPYGENSVMRAAVAAELEPYAGKPRKTVGVNG